MPGFSDGELRTRAETVKIITITVTGQTGGAVALYMMKIIRGKIALAGILSALLVSGCSSLSDNQAGKKVKEVVVATVDDGKITQRDLASEILEIRGFSSTLEVEGATREEIVKALQRLIRKALIIEEAKKMGVDVDEGEVDQEIMQIKGDYPEGTFGKLLLKEGIDERIWKEKLKQTLLIKKASEIIKDRATPATQKELYRYLANNKITLREKVVVPKRWYIVEYVFISKDDAERARELVQNSDGSKDAEILNSASLPATIYDLGYLSERRIGKDYVNEVTSLEAQGISRVVKLPSSYAFFRVRDVQEKHVKRKEEAIEEIKEKISVQKREEFLSKWLQQKYNESTIKVNEAALGKLEGVRKGDQG